MEGQILDQNYSFFFSVISEGLFLFLTVPYLLDAFLMNLLVSYPHHFPPVHRHSTC